MNKPPETTEPLTSDLAADLSAAELIGDYLDHLCRPLVGVVPYAQRQRLRAEAEDHLLTHKEELQREGHPALGAATLATERYGEPTRVGRQWAEQALSPRSARTTAWLLNAATVNAFGWFGIFTVLNLFLIEQSLFFTQNLNLATLTQPLGMISPVIAGGLTGLLTPGRPIGGVCRAVIVLSLCSLAAGVLLLPSTDALLFAQSELLVWLPVGCVAAMMVAGVRHQVRLTLFHRFARLQRRAILVGRR